MVRIKSPSQAQLEKAEEEFKDLLHDSNWIGSPEKSVEVLVSGKKSPLYGNSVLAVEPYLGDTHVIASFRSVSSEDYNDLLRENSRKVHRVNEDFAGNDFYFEADRLGEINRKLGISPFSNYVFEADFKALNEDFYNALLFEKVVSDKDVFEITQGGISGQSRGENVSDTFEQVQKNLSVNVELNYMPGNESHLFCKGYFNSGEANFEARNSVPAEREQAEKVMRTLYENQRDNGSLNDLKIENS